METAELVKVVVVTTITNRISKITTIMGAVIKIHSRMMAAGTIITKAVEIPAIRIRVGTTIEIILEIIITANGIVGTMTVDSITKDGMMVVEEDTVAAIEAVVVVEVAEIMAMEKEGKGVIITATEMITNVTKGLEKTTMTDIIGAKSYIIY